MDKEKDKESAFPAFSRSDDGVPLCWGCAAESSRTCKLGVQRIDVDSISQSSTGTVACPASWQGGPGVAHGGWITCVFDEVLGSLPAALDVPCVTASLEVTFRKPVPVERALTVTAWVAERRHRRWVIEGVMRVEGDADVVYARGVAKFVEPALNHFEKTRGG
ncbi:thioesterase superfamily protein [Mycolicibacterium rhodesiae JS60]|nr:thioesterase superfamily protein [Mycolicibacterium rhodesiae JS60]